MRHGNLEDNRQGAGERQGERPVQPGDRHIAAALPARVRRDGVGRHHHPRRDAARLVRVGVPAGDRRVRGPRRNPLSRAGGRARRGRPRRAQRRPLRRHGRACRGRGWRDGGDRSPRQRRELEHDQELRQPPDRSSRRLRRCKQGRRHRRGGRADALRGGRPLGRELRREHARVRCDACGASVRAAFDDERVGRTRRRSCLCSRRVLRQLSPRARSLLRSSRRSSRGRCSSGWWR